VRRVRPRWTDAPEELRLVRHGESVGNQADTRARDAEAEELDLEHRDADVPLSERGHEQTRSLGRWLAGLPAGQRPTLAITSPYRRAADTAREALRELDVPLLFDERLRERDLGILDGLTGKGIRARHPEEAARRSKLGKFYYSPPSGESWSDVVLRARSLLLELREGYGEERVWLFTHQAVIMGFRYALEGLSEEEILDIDREVRIPNASVTTYRRRDGDLELEAFCDTTGVDGTAVTREDEQAGAGSRER
jgi:broad specificity phosphatase PhoE